MKTFEQFNHIDIDPYGEENWEENIINPGYYKIRMIKSSGIILNFGYYDELEFVIDHESPLFLDDGEILYVDIIEDYDSSVALTIDTGDDYIGIGSLSKDCFEIIAVVIA